MYGQLLADLRLRTEAIKAKQLEFTGLLYQQGEGPVISSRNLYSNSSNFLVEYHYRYEG